jgi:peptidoglycan hydrolase-like protein with peptidoglycan-binding domain
MATYRLGSSGEEVKQIQTRLQALRLYRGPIDGAFGGGTEAAEDVRARKLCIAKGEGVVHGVRYNLEEQFGIQLK